MYDRIVAVDDDFNPPPATRNRLARNHGLFVVDRSLGDGTTDATAAIQSALAAAGQEGGTVLLPGGTYMKGAALTVPSGVTVAGTGAGTVVKNFPGANAHVFQTSSGTQGITLRDLVADGTNDGSHTVPLSVIYLNGCTRSRFTRLDVTGGVRLYAWPDPLSGRGEGIELISGSSHNRLSDIYAYGNRYDGVKLGSACNYNIISNLRGHNNGKGALQFAHRVHGTTEAGTNSAFNQATNVTATHDTGNPGPGGSPHTNGITFHWAEDNIVTGLVVTGTNRGIDAADANPRNAVHGAQLRVRDQIGTLPEYWSDITYAPFDGSVAPVHWASGNRDRKLLIDSRGLVYDNGTTETVLTIP